MQRKPTNSEEILDLIVAKVNVVLAGLEEHPFKRDHSLEFLGANSVDRAEILILTLEELDLNIPLVDTFGPRNIGELADLLYEKLRQ